MTLMNQCGQLLQWHDIPCHLSAFACLKVSAEEFCARGVTSSLLARRRVSSSSRATTVEEVGNVLQQRSCTHFVSSVKKHSHWRWKDIHLGQQGTRQFFHEHQSRTEFFCSAVHLVHSHDLHCFEPISMSSHFGVPSRPPSPCVLLPLRPVHRPLPFPHFHGLLSSSAREPDSSVGNGRCELPLMHLLGARSGAACRSRR